METKLIELRTNLELLEAAYSIRYDQRIEELENLIMEYFCKPFNAMCVRRWYRTSLYENNVVLMFELGFYNDTERRVDFASDMTFRFDGDNLFLNHSTCGEYLKIDTYQVLRAKLIAHVWENIEVIEKTLHEFVENIKPECFRHFKEKYDLQAQINNIEAEQRTNNLKSIEASIVPGVKLMYKEDCNILNKYRHFSGLITVTKTTPKFATVCSDYKNPTTKIRIERLVDHMFKGYINIVEG